MGEVYRALDTRLQRIVAVKILPSHLSENPEAKERFDREARTISSLNHPNICTLHDVGHQDGVDYLVMEYLEGETLASRLDKGALASDQVFKYGIEICEGLEMAHRTGIVHRDLKPGNVMLTQSGRQTDGFRFGEVFALKGVSQFKFDCKSVQPRRKFAAHRKGDDRRNIPVHVAGASTGKRSGRTQ